MTQPVEDDQRLPPGCLGRAGLTVGVAGIAQVQQRIALSQAIAKITIQVNGPGQAGNCLRALAEVVMSVTETVQGAGFSLPVADHAVQAKSVPAVRQCLGVVAEPEAAPADSVTGGRLLRP